MAPLVRNGGSRHTGQAALPHKNIQLEAICKILGIEEEQKHRATYDCLMILKMLRAIETMEK